MNEIFITHYRFRSHSVILTLQTDKVKNPTGLSRRGQATRSKKIIRQLQLHLLFRNVGATKACG